jgi:hypothetical protein
MARGHAAGGKEIHKIELVRFRPGYHHFDERSDKPAAETADKPLAGEKFPKFPM